MEKICLICNKAKCAYKCPTCKEPYCSVTCYKEHNATKCQQKDLKNEILAKKEKKPIKYEFPTEDTVPIEMLEQLRYSDELKNTLRNPHVRDIMRAVVNDENPTKSIALAMTEPIFVEMADACLKVVELPECN